ncbi:DUF3097 domain-containing protein [Micrococcales bacterium 31B]|nr:DUF3097 domain-containing protein [Micrococcales bacterium 31B]
MTRTNPPEYFDRYGRDVLGGSSPAPHRPRLRTSREVAAERDLVVEDAETGWVGAIVRCEKIGGMHVVGLEDRRGRVKSFQLGPGFLLDGEPVILTAPRPQPAAATQGPARTASGSRAVLGAKARVAIGSRIWVEGKHDAELVERVWGDDLRVEGVVVELLDGADHLAERLDEFGPEPGRRVGVLLDHLVAGSKETRLAEAITSDRRYRGLVHIVGHPYIDIWQAVKPERVGIAAWPEVPRGEDFKQGTLKRLGQPHGTHAHVAAAWQAILGRVRSYQDLEPALLGRVEELIDFVTAA